MKGESKEWECIECGAHIFKKERKDLRCSCGNYDDKKFILYKKSIEGLEIFAKQAQAKKFLEQQPIYYDKSKLWWIWDKEDYRWKIIDETDILVSINETLGLDTIESKSKNEILEALKQVSRKNRPKEIKPSWIQFKDVIYDIETGEEIKAEPKYFVTNPIPWELNQDKFVNTPIMDKIFTEWVGEEYTKTLYEIIAYCLLPDYPLNRLFCFIGEGMNGKSKFLELISRFLGQENISSTELDTLLNSRFEITRLHKKLVCLMGETNFNEMKKTSILKKLTGGDLIGFEYKNKDLINDKNYAKILISTNNLPTTDDKTTGFYRRWLIVEFPNRFNEKKDILGDIPEEEYTSLALKSTLILKDLLTKREFHNEGTVEDRRSKFEAKADFLKKFLEEYTSEAYDGHITKADFYKRFCQWCRENNHRELAENTLGKKMKEKGYEQQKKYFDWLSDGKGGRIPVWKDIKWKE